MDEIYKKEKVNGNSTTKLHLQNLKWSLLFFWYNLDINSLSYV